MFWCDVRAAALRLQGTTRGLQLSTSNPGGSTSRDLLRERGFVRGECAAASPSPPRLEGDQSSGPLLDPTIPLCLTIRSTNIMDRECHTG